MSAQMVNLNLEIDPILKDKVEKIYSGLGITLSEAINIFMKQSLLVGGIPFSVDYSEKIFNDETEEAIREARAIVEGKISAKSYLSAKELFQELDSEEC